jgi:hypothetical protein
MRNDTFNGNFAPNAEWVVGGRPLANRGLGRGLGRGLDSDLGKSKRKSKTGGEKEEDLSYERTSSDVHPLGDPLDAYTGSVQRHAFNGFVDGLQVLAHPLDTATAVLFTAQRLRKDGAV